MFSNSQLAMRQNSFLLVHYVWVCRVHSSLLCSVSTFPSSPSITRSIFWVVLFAGGPLIVMSSENPVIISDQFLVAAGNITFGCMGAWNLAESSLNHLVKIRKTKNNGPYVTEWIYIPWHHVLSFYLTLYGSVDIFSTICAYII